MIDPLADQGQGWSLRQSIGRHRQGRQSDEFCGFLVRGQQGHDFPAQGLIASTGLSEKSRPLTRVQLQCRVKELPNLLMPLEAS